MKEIPLFKHALVLTSVPMYIENIIIDMKAYMHSFVCIYRKIDIVFYIQSFIYICSCTLGA